MTQRPTPARHVPDNAVRSGYSRSLADKSPDGPPGPMQVTVRAVSAFQAGHEGSIPFARSNPKPQVTGAEQVVSVISHGSVGRRRATHGPQQARTTRHHWPLPAGSQW